MPKDMINTYQCDNRHETVTIDRDNGTTPMIIGCPVCSQSAFSGFYRVGQDKEPTHEWYTPTKADWEKVLAESPRSYHDLRNHVSKGGLLVRKIEKEGVESC